MAKPIEVSEDQVLYFRSRRGHLAGAGATDVAAAASAIIGAQSQQLPPSLLALSMRTKGRPTAAKIKSQLLGSSPKLVRTWGQRDTLHLYHAAEDWARIIAAHDQWQPGGRGGPMPSESTLDKAFAVLEASSDPITRTDLIDVAPKSYVKAIAERAKLAGMDAKRLAAARLIWRLAYRGEVCLGDKIGAEQTYAARSAWFGKLKWKPPDPMEAALELTRKYLAVYGPATAQDVAHFFNAKVSAARRWLGRLDAQLTGVKCGDRKGLVILADDVATLKAKAPTDAGKWPVRLLPMWESMMMGHADKTWTVPEEAERKLVWRKAAMVSPSVLARGRVVATWSQRAAKRRLTIEVQPMAGWRKTKHLAEVKREASAVAAHLELDEVGVVIE